MQGASETHSGRGMAGAGAIAMWSASSDEGQEGRRRGKMGGMGREARAQHGPGVGPGASEAGKAMPAGDRSLTAGARHRSARRAEGVGGRRERLSL